jgi:hypothetical protein
MHEKRRFSKTAPTTRRSQMSRATSIIAAEPNLLASIRELYSRLPETRYFESWEMQDILYSLNYTDDLAEDAEIVAAIEVARTDWTPDEGIA